MKSLKLISSVVASNFGKLDRPYKLNFSVTYLCQSRCTHCSIWQIRPKDELNIGEIKEFAAKNPYFSWIELSGGEPFLRQDIVEIAKAFVDNCNGLFLLTLPTNSLCNYDMEIAKIEQIAALGIPNFVITVSLDGHRELHDRIRGVPGNYDKAIRMFNGIKELSNKYKNLDCVFGYTIIKQNAGHLAETFERVKKDVPGVRHGDFHINIGQTSENYYDNSKSDILAGKEAAASDIAFILNGAKKERGFGVSRAARAYLENRYMQGMLAFLKNGKSPVANRDGELSIFIDSYGNVFPSIMTTMKLGNIRTGGNDIAVMLENSTFDEGAQSHYTSCEVYQSLLGSLLKW
jgi:MoaA/NifB/PqqE/SkfB family radical SAM enzyme